MAIRTGINSGIKLGTKQGLVDFSKITNLSLRTPITQTFGSPNATHQYLLQDTVVGDYPDTGTGTTADIDTFTTGYQEQTAPGIWDGASYTSTKAWETSAVTSLAAVSNAAVFDSNNTDLYVRMYFRISEDEATDKSIATKRTGAGSGWDVTLTSTGTIEVTIEDTSANTITVTVTGNHADGALHFLEFYYNDTADELTVNTDLDDSNAATDTSTVTTTLTTAAVFTLGNAAGVDRVQWVCVEGAEGAAAATMFAETGWWTYGSALSTAHSFVRASTASFPVTANHVSHYSDDQMCIGYHAGFDDPTKRGIWFNSVVTNLLTYSEDITQWTATNTTVAASAMDAPDGFRSACTVTATADNGHVALIYTTVASKPYTESIWIKRNGGSDVSGRLILHDETGATEVSSLAFSATSEWTRIKFPTDTVASQISSSIRVEIDTSGESIGLWGAQVNKGVGVGVYVRTTSTTDTSAFSVYHLNGDDIYVPRGEIGATFVQVMTLDEGTEANTIWFTDEGSINNRYAKTQPDLSSGCTTRGPLGEVETDLATVTAIAKGITEPIVIGGKSVFVMYWDIHEGTDGFECAMDINGIRHLAAELAYAPAMPYNYINPDVYIGVDLGLRTDPGRHAMDGVLQEFYVWNGMVNY